jgi:hypothetical protein
MVIIQGAALFLKTVVCVLVGLLAGCTSTYAKNANDIMNIFGGIMQSTIAQATQAEWKKLPQSELTCVDQTLRRRGSDLQAAIRQGITPSDPRIADVRSACKQSTVQNNSSDTSIYYVANTTPPDGYLSLRTNPSTSDGQRITTMPNGTLLRVLQRQDDGWWHVKVIPSGPEGWAISRIGNKTFIACCTTAAAVQAPAQSSPVTENQPAQTEQLLWDLNGSTAYLIAKGRSRKFYYKEPRSEALDAGAKTDSLIFDGEIIGDDQYQGTAYLFNSRCGQLPYQVSGPILDQSRRVELRGQAPRVDDNCRIIGYIDDTLAFQLIEPTTVTSNDGETAQSKIAEATKSTSDEEAKRKISEAEAAKRTAEAELQRKTADAEAAKRAADESAKKAADYKRQIEEQKERQNIYLIVIVCGVLLIGCAFFLFKERKKEKVASESLRASLAAIEGPAIAKAAEAKAAAAKAAAAKAAAAKAADRLALDIAAAAKAEAEDTSTLVKVTNDFLDQLAKYSELRNSGILTEEEFSEIKRKLIGPSPSKQLSHNDYIKQLRSLRDKGDLTEDEFQSKVLASLK